MRGVVGFLCVVVLVGCGQAARQEPSPEATTTPWVRLSDTPLSPRNGPTVATVGHRVIVVGGDTGDPCPPNADCVAPSAYARDGASYDPVHDAWQAIADAPSGITDSASHAVVGQTLYVAAHADVLAYDVAADTWTRLEPPGDQQWRSLVADGDRLLLVHGSDERLTQPDLVYSPGSGAWSELPDDPLGTSFDRAVTPTPSGLVLTAHRILADGQPEDPALVRAALLPRGSDSWVRLPVGDTLGGGRWVWSGTRLVDPSPGGADGGEVNGYGRTIPFASVLDVRARTWATLSGVPDEAHRPWSVEAPGAPVTAAAGFLYDDRAGTWTRLTRPDAGPDAPGPAAWLDSDTLLVVGGSDQQRGAAKAADAYSGGVWRLDLVR